MSSFESAIRKVAASLPAEHSERILALLKKDLNLPDPLPYVAGNSASADPYYLLSETAFNPLGAMMQPSSNLQNLEHAFQHNLYPQDRVQIDQMLDYLNADVAVDAVISPPPSPEKKKKMVVKKRKVVMPSLAQLEEKGKRVGIYGPQARLARIEKHRMKRLRRDFHRIRYKCRQVICKRRVRVDGRFLKRKANEPPTTAAAQAHILSIKKFTPDESKGDADEKSPTSTAEIFRSAVDARKCLPNGLERAPQPSSFLQLQLPSCV